MIIICFLFHSLSSSDIELYKSKISLVTKQFNRGDIIFNEGDICNYLAIINYGKIIAKNTYSDGHETVIRILTTNDSIGEALIFSSNNEYKATFVCDLRSQVSLISYDDLKKIIQLDERINMNLLNRISDNLIELNQHVKILGKKTVRSKIATFLYQTSLAKGATTFSINLNKTELAAYLNVERPTLSKEINYLITQHIIANQAYSYTLINISELEKYL